MLAPATPAPLQPFIRRDDNASNRDQCCQQRHLQVGHLGLQVGDLGLQVGLELALELGQVAFCHQSLTLANVSTAGYTIVLSL